MSKVKSSYTDSDLEIYEARSANYL